MEGLELYCPACSDFWFARKHTAQGAVCYVELLDYLGAATS